MGSKCVNTGMNDRVREAGGTEAVRPECGLVHRYRERLYKVQLEQGSVRTGAVGTKRRFAGEAILISTRPIVSVFCSSLGTVPGLRKPSEGHE